MVHNRMVRELSYGALAGPTLLICFVLLCTIPREGTPTHSTTEGNHPVFRAIEASPRILALKKQLASRGCATLEDFWREVKRTGTPLIEPANDNPNEVIVTFIWRGNPSTEGVGLLAPFQDSPGMPNYALTRLLDTDVWYKSWELRDDLRFTYQFLPSVEGSEEGSRKNAVTDSLNPHWIAVSYDDGATTTESSIASMPHALDDSWILKQPKVPAGKLERYQLHSAVLRSQRGISIYMPPGYTGKSKTKYPLLILFDGFFYRTSIPTPTILDNLIYAGKAPPLVAVLMENPRDTRFSDLDYNPAFVEFVSTEVLPWAKQHWNITGDPGKTIVGGLSMGGSAAAFFALRHPELFGNVLSQSGSFADGNGKDVKWEWLATQYEASQKLAIRFFIEEGLLEDVSREGPTGVTANRHFVEVLKNKGYAVTYEEVGGSHEPVHWRAALPYALMALAR